MLRRHRVATFLVQIHEHSHKQASAPLRIFQSDFAYWAVSRLIKWQSLILLGAPGAVVAALNPKQREAIGRFIDDMI